MHRAMFERNKTVWNKERIAHLTDIRNIGLYVFGVIVLAMTWSGIKTVQTNYELQKQINTLKGQNAVIQLQNQNAALQNQFLRTDQYLELAARQNLGLAAPGEKIMLVPKNVAMKYVDQSLLPASAVSINTTSSDKRSKYAQNLEDWRDFLLGRKIFDN